MAWILKQVTAPSYIDKKQWAVSQAANTTLCTWVLDSHMTEELTVMSKGCTPLPPHYSLNTFMLDAHVHDWTVPAFYTPPYGQRPGYNVNLLSYLIFHNHLSLTGSITHFCSCWQYIHGVQAACGQNTDYCLVGQASSCCFPSQLVSRASSHAVPLLTSSFIHNT